MAVLTQTDTTKPVGDPLSTYAAQTNTELRRKLKRLRRKSHRKSYVPNTTKSTQRSMNGSKLGSTYSAAHPPSITPKSPKTFSSNSTRTIYSPKRPTNSPIATHTTASLPTGLLKENAQSVITKTLEEINATNVAISSILLT